MIKSLKDVLIQYFSVQLRHIHCKEIKNSYPHTNFYILVAGQSYYLQLLDDEQFFDIELQISLYQHCFLKHATTSLDHKPFKIVKNKLGHSFTKFKNQFWRMFEIPDQISLLNTVSSTQQAKQVGEVLGKLHAQTNKIQVDSFKNLLPQPFYVEHVIGDFEFALQITEDATIEEAHDAIVYLQDRMPFILQTNKHVGSIFPKNLIHGHATAQYMAIDSQNKVLSFLNWDKMCVGHYLYDYSCMLKSVSALKELDFISSDMLHFSTDYARAAHQGYMYYMQNVLTPQELEHLEDYYKMIILLDSMYYLTQFLFGNKKLKAVYYTQNLNKAINQIKLHQFLTQKNYS